MISSISSGYMVGHLPQNRADHAFTLRNNNDIREPLSRAISFRNSCIPSCIRLWNAVDPSIQNYSALSTVKSRGTLFSRRQTHCFPTESALNQQRHIYTFIPHVSYNSCNYINEDLVHFFLECPTYQIARTNLLRSVDPIMTYIFPRHK